VHIWNTCPLPVNERNCFHTNVFRALQVAVRLDGRQADGLTGSFGHRLKVLEVADAQFEASSGQSMRPEVASPGTLKITLRGSGGRRPFNLQAFDPVHEP
jgi:hypothetical protein